MQVSYRCVIVFIHSVARSIPDKFRRMEKPKAIKKTPDVIGVAPIVAAILGFTAEATAKVRCAPSPYPTLLLIHKSDTLKIGIVLLIIYYLPLPRAPAVLSFKNCPFFE